MKRYLYTIFYIIFFFNSAISETKINPIQEGNPDAKIKLIVYESTPDSSEISSSLSRVTLIIPESIILLSGNRVC